MTFDFQAMGAKAASEGKDMTKAQAGGGGDFAPPKAGFVLLRLVGYFEIGKQKGMFAGKPTIKDKAMMVFELSGPNHPPIVTEAGDKIPMRLTIEETLSLNEKARFFKLFGRMNYAGKATHMVQLMGEGYKAKIIHRKYAKKGEDKSKPETWTGVAAELYDKVAGTYTIEPPRREVIDMDESSPNFQMPTGEYAAIPVPAALTDMKAFLWDYSPIEHWNALFIEGEYPERKDEKTGKVIAPAKSKNVIQNLIKGATNFKGSRIYTLIAELGGNLDIPDSESMRSEGEDGDDEGAGTQAAAPVTTPTGSDADDALNAGDDALAGVV